MPLTFSVSQHANVDVQALKRYANRHFSDHFGQYRGNIQFPLIVDISTGENRDTRFFETEEEFLLFINTDDSLYSWNTGESEILVLATIINQPITVVHFQQQGFAPGTPLEQRCDVKVYQPIPFLETDSPYKQSSGPWLLHEDLVHFSLLVPNDIVEPEIETELDVDALMNEIVDDELDVDAFINGIISSIFPGETDPNGNQGEGTIPTTQTSTSCPAQNLLNVSRYDVSTESASSYSPPSEASSSSFESVPVRKSQRATKRKQIFDNSEVSVRRPKKKKALSKSVESLLRVPSLETQRAERIAQERDEPNERDEEIRQDRILHEEEMARLDKQKQKFLAKQKKKKEFSD